MKLLSVSFVLVCTRKLIVKKSWVSIINLYQGGGGNCLGPRIEHFGSLCVIGQEGLLSQYLFLPLDGMPVHRRVLPPRLFFQQLSTK